MADVAVVVFVALLVAGCGVVEPAHNTSHGGNAPSPNDFPEASQSLAFSGQFQAQVSIGRPNSCGWATGPSGPLFAYGVYFTDGGHLFLFSLLTDPIADPYKGPGAYKAHASLARVGPDGHASTEYQGDITLVVKQDPTSARAPGGDQSPNTGSVDGVLHDRQGRAVGVTGGWTCVPGLLLGPG